MTTRNRRTLLLWNPPSLGRASWPLILAITFLIPSAFAQSSPSTQPAGPRVIARDLAGRTVAGRLLRADLATIVQVHEPGKPVATIAAADLLWLAVQPEPPAAARPVPWFADEPLPGKPAPKPQPAVRVTLRDGQTLAGTLVAGSDDTLVLNHVVLDQLSFPFSRLREIHLHHAALVSAPRAPATRTADLLDTVSLTNGDRLEGIVRSLACETLTLESATGESRTLPIPSVQAIHFAETPPPAASDSSPSTAAVPTDHEPRTADTRPRPSPLVPRPSLAWLHLPADQRLRVRNLAWNAAKGVFSCLHEDRPVTIAPADLIAVEPISPRWQWLTTLAPARYDHQPLLAPRLTYRIDRTATGSAVVLAAQPVLRAIGMPSRSTLQYDLDGSHRRLLVWPILDGSAATAAAVTAVIRLDDQEAWKGTITPSTTLAPVIVDLSDHRRLTLEVQSLAPDIRTRFVWAWPALIR